ncbi:MAG: hypothetical protein KY466_02530 [Gemmatimonadetes bacterium]|nr:hypothetical protein [Gemmatimonadota bacterium]
MDNNTARRSPRPPRLGALVLLGFLIGGCGKDSAAAPRLTDGEPSIQALGAAVWNAVIARDTAALDRLRLSEYEHNELVWPEQPGSREPSAAANLDLWWNNIQVRNRAAVQDLLRKHAGSPSRVAGVECRGGVLEFATFEALTGCRLLLSGPEGPWAVEAFRHVLRMDGRHKVVRYYGDE